MSALAELMRWRIYTPRVEELMTMRKILLAVVVCGLAFEGTAQTYFQRLKSFGSPESSGPSGPQAGLTRYYRVQWIP